MNQITYIVYHFWVLVVYHTYCVSGWVFFYFFFPSSEHRTTSRTNFPLFGSFSTKKEFLSIFRCFAKSFLHFWKKKTKVQHTNSNVWHVKFSNYHINSRNFWHIEFLAAQTCIAWFLFRIKWKFTANKRWNNENQTEKTKNIGKFSENN